jgi:hypothetical protein
MIYVVLGCHKSGTTLVSEILHRSGIPMGADTREGQSYDSGNYFERREWVHLNQDILGYRGSSHNHPAPHPLVVRKATLDALRREITRCEEDSPSWGFKDPRTCLTYPILRDHLPAHVTIAVYRSLEEYWSNQIRNRPKRHKLWKTIRTWSAYNSRLVEILVQRRQLAQPFILLRYEELMRGSVEFQRLADFMGRELHDPRKQALYRSEARGKVRIAIADRVLNATGRPQPSRIRRSLDDLAKQTIAIGAK